MTPYFNLLIQTTCENYSPWRPYFDTLRPRQNGRHFPDDIFNCIFWKKTMNFGKKNSLKFVPKGPINNIPALVQILSWRRQGDKPLSEPMIISLLTHTCVTRPQWVKICFTIAPVQWINRGTYGYAWLVSSHYQPQQHENYRKTSSISRTKSQNFNVSCILLHLSSLNPLEPGVKFRMEM